MVDGVPMLYLSLLAAHLDVCPRLIVNNGQEPVAKWLLSELRVGNYNACSTPVRRATFSHAVHASRELREAIISC